MSQYFLNDNDGHEWMVGFDNPCGGFFATRFLPDEEAEETGEEADVLIGFGIGVTLGELNSECSKHGLNLSGELLSVLFQDKLKEERPLSPLQQYVFDMFNGVLGD